MTSHTTSDDIEDDFNFISSGRSFVAIDNISSQRDNINRLNVPEKLSDSVASSSEASLASHNPSSKPTQQTLDLEDGWDFVEDLSQDGRSHKLENSKSSSSRSASTPAHVPLKSSSKQNKVSKNKQSSASDDLGSQQQNNLEINSDEIRINAKASKNTSFKNRSSTGTDKQVSEVKKSGTTSNLKHRLYCTLYNIYHALPSDPPSIHSNTTIWMMGIHFNPTSKSDENSKAQSSSSSSSSSSSPNPSTTTFLSPQNTPSSAGSKKDKKSGLKKSSSKNNLSATPNFKDEFFETCRSLLYFSYRKDFLKLDGFNVTSDVGWGCMLRTGQMMLAVALQRLFEPVELRQIDKSNFSSLKQLLISMNKPTMKPDMLLTLKSPQTSSIPPNTQLSPNQKILSWFYDFPDLEKHPYSIHSMVQSHLALNSSFSTNEPQVTGPTWFSPTKLTRILKFLVRMHSPDQLTMYVPPEGTIYVDEVVALCINRTQSTRSPPPENANGDPTLAWWQQFSSGVPQVARSTVLLFDKYEKMEENAAPEDFESSFEEDLELLENDEIILKQLEEEDQEAAESTEELEKMANKSDPVSKHPDLVMTDPNSMLIWSIRDWDGHSSIGREMLVSSTSDIPREATLSPEIEANRIRHKAEVVISSESATNEKQPDSTKSSDSLSLDSSKAWVHLPSNQENSTSQLSESTLFDSFCYVSNDTPRSTDDPSTNSVQKETGSSKFNLNMHVFEHEELAKSQIFSPGYVVETQQKRDRKHSKGNDGLYSKSTPRNLSFLDDIEPADLDNKISTSVPSRSTFSSASSSDMNDLNNHANSTENINEDFWRPLLIVIPSRLGVQKVNPVYIEHLKFCLSSPSSIGIVGGKPNKSLFFVAFQDDNVFYLDPHFVNSTVKPTESFGSEIHESYKSKYPQKLKFSELDPSLALGFFLRTRSDFQEFCQAHHNFALSCQGNPSCEPIFTIHDTAPDYLKE